MGKFRSLIAALATLLVLCFATLPSHAFCGFYINTGEAPLYNDATRVVLMRIGMRTVMSIQNDYKGPPENFALVVPVPIVLERENVRTLERSVFDHIDKLSSPRLVEYWERDPCYGQDIISSSDNKEGGTGTRAKGEEGSMGNPRPLVKVEREFSVDEYDVVVLSALDSSALETWLLQNNYKIPKGAEPFLRPYVQDGSKFFVAKVSADRIRFRWGRATLSPLRFFFDTPTFTLPTRLGLINAGAAQDLIVNIIAPDRYETANYENLLIPTNLGVRDEVRTQFNSFYASLFDQTVAGHKHAVVTEYSWAPTSCDPCPFGAGPLMQEDLETFGLDVMGKPAPSGPLTLTRLHARWGRDSAGDDLVFKAAPTLIGGREERDQHDNLVESHLGSRQETNSFQARYVIRHKWEGGVWCSSPHYGVWGENPDSSGTGAPTGKPATKAAFAARNLDVKSLILDSATERSHAGRASSSFSLALLYAPFEAVFTNGSRDQRALRNISLSLVVAFVAFIVAWRRKLGGVKTGLVLVAIALLMLALTPFAGDRYVASRVARVEYQFSDLRPFFGWLIGAVLVTFAIRTRRLALAIVSALAPLAGGMLDAVRQSRMVDAAIADPSVDAAQATRILAEGTSELLEPVELGALRSGVLLLLVCVVFLTNSGGLKARLSALIPRHAVAWIAIAIAVTARVLLVRTYFMPFDVAIVLTFIVAALVISSRSSDATTTPTTMFELVISAMVGVVLLDVASRLTGIGAGLGAISGESVDPSQRVRIMVWAVSNGRARLILTFIDASLLLALLVWRFRSRGESLASEAGSLLLRSLPSIGAVITLFFFLAMTITTLGWTQRDDRLQVLAASTARLSPYSLDELSSASASSSSSSSSSSPGGDVSETLRGPSFFVNAAGTKLYGATALTAQPEVFTPRLYERMATSAGDSSLGPLLVTPRSLTLGKLVTALAPALKVHQVDYRMMLQLDPEAVRTDLGPFMGLLASEVLVARPIDLVVSPRVTTPMPPSPTPAPSGVDAKAPPKSLPPVVAMVLDGQTLHAFLVGVTGDGYQRGPSAAFQTDLPADVREPMRRYDEADFADMGTAAGRLRAAAESEKTTEVLVAFALDTPITEVDKILATITELRASSFRSYASPKPLFTRIVVTAARETVLDLRPR